jgi:hypothetical protein
MVDVMREYMREYNGAERWVLRGILPRFGDWPFAEEELSGLCAEGPWTGAEIRLALRRLVRDGVLVEWRPAWGDLKWRLPAAAAVRWYRVLFPLRPDPLPETEEHAVRRDTAAHRLPLSLELLLVWADLERRGGLPLTRRGGPHRTAAARLAAEMRLKAEELAGLPFPPDASEGLAEERNEVGFTRDGGAAEHGGLPPQLALALDLGQRCRALKREPERIAVDPAGLADWLGRRRSEADDALHSLLLEHYASRNPALLFAACTLRQFPSGRWFRVADAVRAGADADTLEAWMAYMVSFGWLERGRWRDERVFRWKKPPEEADRPSRALRVLPDLEVWALPEAGLRCRYELERIAERTSADEVFVYRLTQSACARAQASGLGREAVVTFLERESGNPLAASVQAALADWFAGPAAGTSEGPPPENRRAGLQDTVTGGNPDRGAVDGEAGQRPAPDRGMAYPAPAGKGGFEDRPAAARESAVPASASGNPGPSGPDDESEELFPGLKAVPPTWLHAMRRYHPSTAGLLVRQALAWRTGLRLSVHGREIEFVPLSLERTAEQWEARGFIRERKVEKEGPADVGAPADAPPYEVRAAVIRAADVAELRIVLPAGLTGQPSGMV